MCGNPLKVLSPAASLLHHPFKHPLRTAARVGGGLAGNLLTGGFGGDKDKKRYSDPILPPPQGTI